MAKAEDKNARFKRLLPAVLLWLAAGALYAAGAYYVLVNGQTWADEVIYLVKSYWYATGVLTPYSSSDATWSMPLFFYQLGFWQQAAGIGLMPGRVMSIVMGALSAVLLFAICRRLTANTSAAAAAAFIFLATPATAYYFASATPAATVALLHLAAAWLIVSGLGRPRFWASIAMGLLCSALFFTSQNMILAVIVLAPLYVLAVGRERVLHATALVLALALSAAAMLVSFPEKLTDHAMRLPGLAPLLEGAGLLPPNFTLIERGTTAPSAMDLAFDQLSLVSLIDAFLLPYAGTLLLALMVFRLAGKGLRVLWIAPAYFLYLAAAHFVGSAGFCSTCILSYTPQFAALGALAGALSLAVITHWGRQNGISGGPLVIGGALLAVAANVFAPGLAFSDEYKFFPTARVSLDRTTTERQRVENLAQWVASSTSPGEPVLVIHSLGNNKVPALPYAAFLAGHKMPVQSLDLAGTQRTIRPDISGAAREAVQAAIEEESLWTDATMRRWINRDFDLILFQEDKSIDQSRDLISITAQFEQVAETSYKGSRIFLFARRPVQ